MEQRMGGAPQATSVSSGQRRIIRLSSETQVHGLKNSREPMPPGERHACFLRPLVLAPSRCPCCHTSADPLEPDWHRQHGAKRHAPRSKTGDPIHGRAIGEAMKSYWNLYRSRNYPEKLKRSHPVACGARHPPFPVARTMVTPVQNMTEFLKLSRCINAPFHVSTNVQPMTLARPRFNIMLTTCIFHTPSQGQFSFRASARPWSAFRRSGGIEFSEITATSTTPSGHVHTDGC
jgi:hypothetical protein